MERQPLEAEVPVHGLADANEMDVESQRAAAERGLEDDCGPAFFEEEEECAALLGRVREIFDEYKSRRGDEVQKVDFINETLPTAAEDAKGVAATFERMERIISIYQESPHLLHGYLESLLGPLMWLLEHLIPTATEVWHMEKLAEGGNASVATREVSYALGMSYDEYLLHGVLLAIAKTMKFGQRTELLQYVPQLIPSVAALFSAHSSDTLLCKAAVKVQQRLAMALLKGRSAPWRYHKRVTFLAHNLGESSMPDSRTLSNSGNNNEVGDDEGDDCVVEGVGLEDAIGLLLEAVCHKDTVVRWSAAKGVARVCSRLSRTMAEDVITAVLDVFDNEHSDSSWHGGLLAVAELCRRSILHPRHLSTIVQFTTRGLSFDLSKGTYSVGSHVRDAACYVCWSIARAYDADDIKEHVYKLSTSLVVTSLFDREVHVRRAAAAAFQESVGRLGNFPDGIRLITTMDFFSLASLQNAYLHVAPVVAENSAYRGCMLDVLVSNKLLHWDRRVRCCAAQALGRLAVHENTDVIRGIARELFDRTVDNSVAVRHGAILALAELVGELEPGVWPQEIIQQIAVLIPRVDAMRMFRSRGGEYVRQACCRLLASVARRRLPLPEAVEVPKLGGTLMRVKTLAKLQEFFDDTWRQILEWLQNDAAEAYEQFAEAYYSKFIAAFHGPVLERLLSGCMETHGPMERRGNFLAIGALPWAVISATPEPVPEANETEPYFMLVLRTAMEGTKLEQNREAQDAESRRNAVRSLTKTLLRIPAETAQLTAALYEQVIQHLLNALDDYAADRRGDVGSFVRLEAIDALPVVVEYGQRMGLCTSAVVLRVICALLKQAMEKLDKLRGRAVTALERVVHLRGVLPQVGADATEAHEMATVCEKELTVLCDALFLDPSSDKTSPHVVFTNLGQPLLGTELFAHPVAEGLVVSAGALSTHIMQPAVNALLHAFRVSSTESVRLSHALVEIAARYAHNERVVVPLCVTINRLIAAGVFDEARHMDLVEILRHELKHFAMNIHALLTLVGVLGDLCRSPVVEARESAWALSLVMLASRYPKVRARMGTDMYTSLLVLSAADSSTDFAQAVSHLTATQWDGSDAVEVRGARDKLYDMLRIARPQGRRWGRMRLKGGRRQAASLLGRICIWYRRPATERTTAHRKCGVAEWLA
uniref:Putative tubulin folding cofactor D n=1 Tax=Trypanosoma vivax (strain Y486) TaxID=1055687 RepID=G0U1L6_TRYVY|nr:putative tubulin folding cofactor D, fragment [Trypanosoma vivax Y486]